MKQSRSKLRILQIGYAAILFGLVALALRWAGIPSYAGQEDIFWERARFLLGKGGASLYDGNSICSLGYSLILAPIGAIIKSPYGQYKAAILLNGVFLCGSWVVSLLAAKKMFPKEKEGFLSAVCFFVVLCPAFATAKAVTGPEMISMFLVWCSIYLLVLLWENYSMKKLALLALCMTFLGFFQISMIGVIGGVVLTLGLFVKQKKLEENGFLVFLLTVLVGLAAGNILERVFLWNFTKETDIRAVSSLEVLLEGMGAGWKNGYLAGMLESVAGKLYSAMAASFLLLGPGIWFFIKKTIWRNKPDMREEKDTVKNGIFLVFLAQIMIMALYSRSEGLGNGLVSLDGLGAVLAPMLVIAAVQLKNSKSWERELTGYILAVCGLACWTAGVFQRAEVSEIAKRNSGILMLFQREEIKAPTAVYMAGCAAVAVCIVLFCCLKGNVKRPLANQGLKIAGLGALAGVCLITQTGCVRESVARHVRRAGNYAVPVAEILLPLGADTDYYYICGEGEGDGIPVIQHLMQEREIRLVQNDPKERAEFFGELKENPREAIVITDAAEAFMEDLRQNELSGYQIHYMTENYAVWTEEDTAVGEKLEAIVTARLEHPRLLSETKDDMEDENAENSQETETESSEDEKAESEAISETVGETNTEAQSETETETETETDKQFEMIYGGEIFLAPGTYRLEIYFQGTGDMSGLWGTATVADENGTLASCEFENNIFDENGRGSLGLEFSSRDVMRECTISLEGTMASHMEITDIFYWKLTEADVIGVTTPKEVKKACDVILELEQKTGAEGSCVGVIDDRAERAEEVSPQMFENGLPQLQVLAVTKGQLNACEAEYLIGETESHSYYRAMDDYSIIYRGTVFTVLVRNDSAQYKHSQKENGILSEGTEVYLKAFSGSKNETRKQITLEAGSYQLLTKVEYEMADLVGGEDAVAGTIRIYGGEEIIAEKSVTNKELQAGTAGEAEIAVPFALYAKTRKISCEIEADAIRELTVDMQGVALAAEKHQIGQEESMLQPLLDMIKRMDGKVKLAVVQTEEMIEKNLRGYDYLREQLPNSEIMEISYEEAVNLPEDTLLLSHGFSANYLKLTKLYNIIGEAGQYTLWARNNGALILEAAQAGAKILSNGDRISPASIAAARGAEYQEGVIEYLPKGSYEVTVELTASELKGTDAVEVILYCDKSEEEIREEIEELTSGGYTEAEAEAAVSEKRECGNVTYQGYQFAGSGSKLAVVEITGKRKIENLWLESFSWHGKEVEGRIIWVRKK